MSTPPPTILRAAAACAVWGMLVAGCASEGAAIDYPNRPYGVNAGDTIENLALQDLDGKPFELKSVYKGRARAVLLYATGTWCFSSKQETEWLNQKLAAGRGDVLPIAVLLENNRHERADATTAKEWGRSFGVTFLTLLDGDGRLDGFRSSGVIPLNLVVDASTMQIVYSRYDFDPKSLEAALAQVIAKEGAR